MYPWIVPFGRSAFDDGYNSTLSRDMYYESSPTCKLYGYFAIVQATIDCASMTAEITGRTVWLESPVDKDYDTIFSQTEPPETVTQSVVSFINTLTESSVSIDVYDFDGNLLDSFTKDFEDIAAGFFVGGSDFEDMSDSDLFYENEIYQNVASSTFSILGSSTSWSNANSYSLDDSYIDTYMNVVAPCMSEYNYFYHLDIPCSLSQVVDGDEKLWYPLLPSSLSQEPAMIPHVEYYKASQELVLTHSFMQPFTPVGSYPYSSGAGGSYVLMHTCGVSTSYSMLYHDSEEAGLSSGKLIFDFEADLNGGTLSITYWDSAYEEHVLLSTLESFARKTVEYDLSDVTAIYIQLSGVDSQMDDAKIYSAAFAGVEYTPQDITDYNHNWYPGFDNTLTECDCPVLVEDEESLDKIELKFSSLDWPETRTARFRVRPRSGDKALVASKSEDDIITENETFDSESALLSSTHSLVTAPDWLDDSGYGYLGFGNTSSRLWKQYSYPLYLYNGRLLKADHAIEAWSCEKDGSTVTPTAISTSGDKFYLDPLLVEEEKTFDSVVDNSRTTGDIDYYLGTKAYRATDAALYKQVYDEETEEWSWSNYRNESLTSSDYSDHPYVLLNFSSSDYYEKDGDYYRAKIVFTIKRFEDTVNKAVVFKYGSLLDLLYKHGEQSATKYGVAKSFSRVKGSGTVSKESGCNVFGDSTDFLSTATPGDVIYISGNIGYPPAVITRVVSDTEIEVDGYDSFEDEEYWIYAKEYNLLEGSTTPENALWPIPSLTSTSVEYPSENDFIDSVREEVESWAAVESWGYAAVDKVFGAVQEDSFPYLEAFETNADYRICKLYIVPLKYTGLIIDVLDSEDNVIDSIEYTASSSIDITSSAREYEDLSGEKYAFVDVEDLKILEIDITAPIMKLGKLLLDDQLNARIINPDNIGTYRDITAE